MQVQSQQGRSPREGNGNLLQYSFLENPINRGAWQATVQRVSESDQTKHAGTLCSCIGHTYQFKVFFENLFQQTHCCLRSVFLLLLVPRGTGLPLTLFSKQRPSSLTESVPQLYGGGTILQRCFGREAGRGCQLSYILWPWSTVLLRHSMKDRVLTPLSIAPLPTQVFRGDSLPALGLGHATSQINGLLIKFLGIVGELVLCVSSSEAAQKLQAGQTAAFRWM